MVMFITMRAIKSAKDLTTVTFADRGQQFDNNILAKNEDHLEEATATRICGVRKFYVAVVNKIIKIFPFHDDVLMDLAALNPDPALLESIINWLFAFASRRMNIMTYSSLSFRTTS